MAPEKQQTDVSQALLAAAIFCLLAGILMGALTEHVRLERQNAIVQRSNLAELIWLDCAVFKFDQNATGITAATAAACAHVAERVMNESENISVTISVNT